MSEISTRTRGDSKSQSLRSALKAGWEFFWPLIALALFTFSTRSSLADWYEVPTGSMLPTIQLGDRVLVNKMAYDLRVPFTSLALARIGEPHRGDVIVFKYPGDNATDYIKRLVGVPGDLIEVKRNVLYVNGVAMDRHEVAQSMLQPDAEPDPRVKLYLEHLDKGEHFVFERGTDSFPATQIPADMYFMMGDNRDNSSDSRVWGFVPRRNLRGQALRVVVSFAPDVPAWNLKHHVRWGRFMLPLL